MIDEDSPIHKTDSISYSTIPVELMNEIREYMNQKIKEYEKTCNCELCKEKRGGSEHQIFREEEINTIIEVSSPYVSFRGIHKESNDLITS